MQRLFHVHRLLTEHPQDQFRRVVEDVRERPEHELEDHERGSQEPRDLLRMRQCNAARRQLAEDDVKERDERDRQHRSCAHAHGQLERRRQRGQEIGEAMRQSLLGERTQPQRRQRDAELACRQQAPQMLEVADHEARKPVAPPRHRFQAGAA
jgi:hypothetical protein